MFFDLFQTYSDFFKNVRECRNNSKLVKRSYTFILANQNKTPKNNPKNILIFRPYFPKIVQVFEISINVQFLDVLTLDENFYFRRELRRWSFVLWIGTVLVYSARVSLPVVSVMVRDEFKWDNNQLGKVMGSFSYGYMMSQIIGGFLADRFGQGLNYSENSYQFQLSRCRDMKFLMTQL